MSMRSLVAGLAAMGPVNVRGVEYTGPSLSLTVSIDLTQGQEESARTPQLIAELGRIAAAALADKEILEAEYIMWREATIIARMDAVEKMSKTAAESWVHGLPEYLEHKKRIAIATEAWSSVHAAFEAAKDRTRAIAGFPQAAEPRGGYTDGARRHGGTLSRGESLPEVEAEVAAKPRTPIPPPPKGPPPPPPRRTP